MFGFTTLFSVLFVRLTPLIQSSNYSFRYLYKRVNSCVSNTADSPSFSVFFNPTFVSFGIFIIADTNKKDFTAILFPV